MDFGHIEVHLAILSTFAYFSINITWERQPTAPHFIHNQSLHHSRPPRLNTTCSEVLLFKSTARPLIALTMPYLCMPSSPCPRPSAEISPSPWWVLFYSGQPMQPECLRACSSPSFYLGPFCITCLNSNYCVCLPLPAPTSTAGTLSETPVWPVNDEETFVERMKL